MLKQSAPHQFTSIEKQHSTRQKLYTVLKKNLSIMSTIYTIIIKNGTTSKGRAYNIFSEAPGVSGGGFQSTTQIVWYKTSALGTNGQATFKYTPDYYAFAGNSVNVNSDALKQDDEVSIQASLLAKVGTNRGDGDQMLVNESLELSRYAGKSKANTFQISTVSDISSPNTNVMGMARKQDKGPLLPVAVVELKPAVSVYFTPKAGATVVAGTAEPGTVNTESIDNKADVAFTGGQKTATVTEGADGTFSVTYV